MSVVKSFAKSGKRGVTMSRIGKKPVIVPDKAKITFDGSVFKVQGPKGTLERTVHSSVELKIEDNIINVIPADTSRQTRALQGMTRALIANMVTGVTTGFERILEVNGIGYKAEVKDDVISFSLGYSHPVDFKLPPDITASIEKNQIKLSGYDKETLGQIAANIRKLRPPEPYKGKGVKFLEETIQRKAGKTGKK